MNDNDTELIELRVKTFHIRSLCSRPSDRLKWRTALILLPSLSSAVWKDVAADFLFCAWTSWFILQNTDGSFHQWTDLIGNWTWTAVKRKVARRWDAEESHNIAHVGLKLPCESNIDCSASIIPSQLWNPLNIWLSYVFRERDNRFTFAVKNKNL